MRLLLFCVIFRASAEVLHHSDVCPTSPGLEFERNVWAWTGRSPAGLKLAPHDFRGIAHVPSVLGSSFGFGGWIEEDKDCIDTDESYRSALSGLAANLTDNYSRDRPFKSRAHLHCFADARRPCFRLVKDAFATLRELDELFDPYDERIPHERPIWKNLQRRMTALLDDSFGTGPLHHAKSYHFATRRGGDNWSTPMRDYETGRWSDERTIWKRLHTDFLSGPEVENWVYTCLIYASDMALGDMAGGETGVVDAVDQLGRVTAALVVEPAIGRLLCFSGGAENFHAARPILAGERRFIQTMFDCGSEG